MATPDIVIHVQDQDDLDVPLASVAVFTSSALYASGRADSGGDFALADVPPGSYTVVVRKEGFRFNASDPLVVADVLGPVTFTLEGVDLEITSPATPAPCRLYGFVSLPDGEEAQATVEEAYAGSWTTLLTAGSSSVHPTDLTRVSTTRVVPVRSGRWEAEVLQGSMVRVRILKTSFDKAVIVPAKTDVSIADCPPYSTEQQVGLVGDTAMSGIVGGRF